jgi:hypothetical protein
MFEALSFKLILDFLQYLKKNRIVVSNIKIKFWDKINYEFVTYEDITQVDSYFNLNYRVVNDNDISVLCSIIAFDGISDLYNFTTNYKISDITGSNTLTAGSQFDKSRNSQRVSLINRQILFINETVKDYSNSYAELKKIFVTGSYSPLYAVPNWGEITVYSSKLKASMLNSSNAVIEEINTGPTGSQPITTVINDYEVKKEKFILTLKQEIIVLANRISFIENIVNNSININTTPLPNIISYLEENEFVKITGSYNYLLNMPIYTLNSQTLSDLIQQKNNKEDQLANL